MIFKLKNILNKGLKTFHHYPLILLFAFISAVSIIFNYEYPNKYTIKIFITASLGISLFFALQTTFEKHKYKFLAYSFGGILFTVPLDLGGFILFGVLTVLDISSSLKGLMPA